LSLEQKAEALLEQWRGQGHAGFVRWVGFQRKARERLQDNGSNFDLFTTSHENPKGESRALKPVAPGALSSTTSVYFGR